jgi:hypothetical protein
LITQRTREVLLGILFGALAIGFALFLNNAQKLDFFALLLTFIAGVYLGFALLDSRPRYLVIEIVAILIFAVFSLLGLWVAPIFLGIGYFAHGIWDFLHHSKIQTRIADWWPPFCVATDWIIAGYILIWLLRAGQ